MPLIRYRTGDIARFSQCAAKYPVMEKISGRHNDGVRLSNGQTLELSELEEIMFENDGILDFMAAYDGNTLFLEVRSLRFDADSIMKTLLASPYAHVLNGCDIRIFSTENAHVFKNTMNKRSIHV
jgi:long-subunit acyl-CoA synthetase (AMP-forming)